MGESAEIASLRAEIEALKTQVMSMRSDMDVSGGEVSSSGTGGPVSGGYGTSWAVPDGYRLPSAGKGGGEGISAFAVKGGKITNRWFLIGRHFYQLTGSDPVASDGYWYLKIPHAEYGDAELICISAAEPGSADASALLTDSLTYIPLYDIYDGAIRHDYRGLPLVMLRE